MRTKIVKPIRICNICSLPEPPRKLPEKDSHIYCFGHVGIHFSYWNLTPAYDAHGNRVPCWKDYQRYLARKKERLGQSTQGINLNATAPEPEEPFAELSVEEISQ